MGGHNRRGEAAARRLNIVKTLSGAKQRSLPARLLGDKLSSDLTPMLGL